MKITKNQVSASRSASASSTVSSSVKKLSSTEFIEHLKKVEQVSSEQYVRDLVDKIIEQGNKLSLKTDIRELKIYKKLISEFFDYVVGGSRKFSKNNFLDRRGRHRVYAVIKKVNEELEQLTQHILNEEKDNIKILQCLDDIRGLILDIIM